MCVQAELFFFLPFKKKKKKGVKWSEVVEWEYHSAFIRPDVKTSLC